MIAEMISYRTFKIGRICVTISHKHDMAALFEVFFMNVYRFDLLRKGDVVFDLGAGIGEYAIMASKIIGTEGLVVAIEPNPIDYNLLLSNLEENGCKNVKTLNKVISTRKEASKIQFKDSTFDAEALDLKHLILELERGGNTGNFTVLKMDIEGSEVEVLKEFTPFLGSLRYIAIELHNTKVEVDRILNPLGFNFKRLTKADYLWFSLKFIMRHPISAIRMLRYLISSGEFPGFKKVFSGIEVSNSNDLMVGLYIKN